MRRRCGLPRYPCSVHMMPEQTEFTGADTMSRTVAALAGKYGFDAKEATRFLSEVRRHEQPEQGIDLASSEGVIQRLRTLRRDLTDEGAKEDEEGPGRQLLKGMDGLLKEVTRESTDEEDNRAMLEGVIQRLRTLRRDLTDEGLQREEATAGTTEEGEVVKQKKKPRKSKRKKTVQTQAPEVAERTQPTEAVVDPGRRFETMYVHPAEVREAEQIFAQEAEQILIEQQANRMQRQFEDGVRSGLITLERGRQMFYGLAENLRLRKPAPGDGEEQLEELDKHHRLGEALQRRYFLSYFCGSGESQFRPHPAASEETPEPPLVPVEGDENSVPEEPPFVPVVGDENSVPEDVPAEGDENSVPEEPSEPSLACAEGDENSVQEEPEVPEEPSLVPVAGPAVAEVKMTEGEKASKERAGQTEGAEEMCVICLERPRFWVFVKCKHLCLCKQCAKKLRADKRAKEPGRGGKTVKLHCPLCRTESCAKPMKCYEGTPLKV